MNKHPNIITKPALSLGFTAAIGTGILSGIESAIMWPSAKVSAGLFFGLTSCFVNSLTYYYVIIHTNQFTEKKNESNEKYNNTIISDLFALAVLVFTFAMFIANYNGMYISYTVLGVKLNTLGNTDLNISENLLSGLGFIFGLSSAISGAILNFSVGKIIWNHMREITDKNIEIKQTEFHARLPDHFGFFSRLARQKVMDFITNSTVTPAVICNI